MKRESITRTLLTVAAVALVCSAMVATAVYLLRPMQKAYAQLDRNRAILAAIGVDTAAMDDRTVVSAFLELDARLVDLALDDFTPAPAMTTPWGYDHWSGPDQAEETPATLVPVYVGWRDGALDRLVLPVHGSGMWSTIYAYVALQPDLATIAELVIYRHGETPGIGDRIEEPGWLARWSGKRIEDDAGTLRLDVVRNPHDSAYQVDLISGASVTSDAVGDLLRHWLGADGYGPLLQRLRQEPGALVPP